MAFTSFQLQRHLFTKPLRTRPIDKWRRRATVDRDRSDLVLQETALFLYQLQYDYKLEQALLFNSYEATQQLKIQRDEVDGLLEKFQTTKGKRTGAPSISAEVMETATAELRLRAQLSEAVEREEYTEAARLRDEIKKFNEQLEGEAALDLPTHNRRFRLGHVVRHTILNYRLAPDQLDSEGIGECIRGVVCGWDFGCCESDPWKKRTTVDELPAGDIQPFYHLLVDEREWPAYTRGPPMGYVAEELLEVIEDTNIRDFDKIKHPLLVSIFLGTDNEGFYIPCKQLRYKYRIDREDIYPREKNEEDAE